MYRSPWKSRGTFGLAACALFALVLNAGSGFAFTVGEGSSRPQLFLEALARQGSRAEGWIPQTAVFREGPGEIQVLGNAGGEPGLVALHDGSETAWFVYGAICAKYVAMGRGLCEDLGYPISDEASTRPSPHPRPLGTVGRRSRFEHGTIYYDPRSGSSFAVHGRLYEYYKQDEVAGWLGFPMSDVYDWNGGKRLDVEDGSSYPPYGPYLFADADGIVTLEAFGPPLSLDGYVDEGNLSLSWGGNYPVDAPCRIYRDIYDPITHSVTSTEIDRPDSAPYEESGLDSDKGYVFTVAGMSGPTLTPRSNIFSVNVQEPCVALPTRLLLRADRLGARQCAAVQVTNFSDNPYSSAVESSDPRVTVSPATIAILPGASATLMVTYTASTTDNVDAEITFAAGGPRIHCECIGVDNGVVHVDPAGSDESGDGSQGAPYRTLRHTLERAPPGSTVQLACGSYDERNLWLREGITLRGDPSDPSCVLLGGGAGWGRILIGYGLGADVTISGITIQGGYIPPDFMNGNPNGGGALLVGCSLRIEDCRFSGNSTTQYGGGVLLDDSSPLIARTLFDHNSAGGGGAVSCFGGAPGFDQCTFWANSAAEGGAIYGAHAGFEPLTNCTFVANWGGVYGPAISGGGFVIDHSIIAHNFSDFAVGAITGVANMSCCDVYGNSNGDYVGALADQEGQNGNISLDPLFRDAPAGDLRVSEDSPCAPSSPYNGGCGPIGALGEYSHDGLYVRVITLPQFNVHPAAAQLVSDYQTSDMVDIIDGCATFSGAAIDDFFGWDPGLEATIPRLELYDNSSPRRLVGHIALNATHREFHERNRLDCFVFLHDSARASGADDGVPDLENDWDYYGQYEYPVTMLIPPRGVLAGVDGGDDWPVLFIHGVRGERGYWGANINAADEALTDSWEYCYPYDQDLTELAALLKTVASLVAVGDLPGIPAYSRGKICLVAHSMGGLVARKALEDPLFAAVTERLLMVGTPNHGSLISWRVAYDTQFVSWLASHSIPLLGNLDIMGPAYRQMSPASFWLNALNTSPPPPLSGRRVEDSYLVLAGFQDYAILPHREIEMQDDGVVAASSASLTNWGIPLALTAVHHLDQPASAVVRSLLPWVWNGLAETVQEVADVRCVQMLPGNEDCVGDEDLDVGLGLITVDIENPPAGAVSYRLDGIHNGRLRLTLNDGLEDADNRAELRRVADGATGYFSRCRRLRSGNFDYDEIGHWLQPGSYTVELVEHTVTSHSVEPLVISWLGTATGTIRRSAGSTLACQAPNSTPLPPQVSGDQCLYRMSVDTHVDTLVVSLSADDIDPVSHPHELALIDPSGAVINEQTAAGMPGVTMFLESPSGPVRFAIAAPAAGAWDISHEGTLTGTTVTAGVYSDIRLAVTPPAEATAEDDSLVFTVEAAGIGDFQQRQVHARAVWTSDEGTSIDWGELPLRELAPDQWEGTLPGTEPGSCELTVTLAGIDAEGQVVERTSVRLIRTATSWPIVAAVREERPSTGPVTPQVAVRPNPFNASTEIYFTLEREQSAHVVIHSLDGRRVAVILDDRLPAGPQHLSWSGRDDSGRLAAAGVYLVQVVTEDGVASGKMMFLK